MSGRAGGRGGQASVGYVLPLRWVRPGPIEELAAYLRRVAAEVDEVLVVDGSPQPLSSRHRAELAGVARHLPPDDDLRFRMGKVNGVVTGIRRCSCERIVLADDDVRYDARGLHRAVALLDHADLVRPQNYFDELPWHARWDTARTLLNRVLTGDPEFPVGDFPGTLAVRRDAFVASGAYDGDVLFENLELMRTIRAAGGRVATPLDLHVARRPPDARHFISQRVRQAYDDFAIPARISFFLAAGPLAAAAALLGRRRSLALSAAAVAAAAEAGRRRSGGRAVFPAVASLLAPAWVLERSACSWLAVLARARGGAAYWEGRLERSATPLSELRRRYPSPPLGPAGTAGGGPLSARNRTAL
jgi:hypothetical protein